MLFLIEWSTGNAEPCFSHDNSGTGFPLTSQSSVNESPLPKN